MIKSIRSGRRLGVRKHRMCITTVTNDVLNEYESNLREAMRLGYI
jgi:hypothetical protein